MLVVVHHSHTLDTKMVYYQTFPGNEEMSGWQSDPINNNNLINLLLIIFLTSYLFCRNLTTQHGNGMKHIAYQERCEPLSTKKLTKWFPLKCYSHVIKEVIYIILLPSYCCGCCSYSAQNWRNFIIFLLSRSDTALVANRSVLEQGTYWILGCVLRISLKCHLPQPAIAAL